MSGLQSGLVEGAATGLYPNRDAWIVFGIVAAVVLFYACFRVTK